MYWYRQLERLGRNSLVGTTISSGQNLPLHLAADEHHARWCKEKGYVAMTVGNECILGVGHHQKYHDHWLHNLNVSASMAGFRPGVT